MRGFCSALLLCCVVLAPFSAFAAGTDSILYTQAQDPVASGVVKSVDVKDGIFVLSVPEKGDVRFRVSAQTGFADELLGGLVATEMKGRLGNLKPGTKVSVQYLTLPPEAPVAVHVDVHK